MIGPFDNFGDLRIVERSGIRLSAPEVAAVPPIETMRREAMAAMRCGALEFQSQQLAGRHLIYPAREGNALKMMKLGRSKLYSLAKPDEVLAAVRAHIAHIAHIAQRGAGRVWFLGEPVIAIDDMGGYSLAKGEGEGDPDWHIMLRSYYGHESQAVEDRDAMLERFALIASEAVGERCTVERSVRHDAMQVTVESFGKTVVMLIDNEVYEVARQEDEASQKSVREILAREYEQARRTVQ